MTAPACYKVLSKEDGMPWHGGTGRWSLPEGDQPGAWMPTLTDLMPCQCGYHLCAGEEQLLGWLGPVIYVAEYRGEMIDHKDKIVVASARLLTRCEHWNERTARLFAAACARDVLPLFERVYPADDRVRRCIEAAEQFARSEIDRRVLDAAAAAAAAAAAVAVAAAAAAADAAAAATWAAAWRAAWRAAATAGWATREAWSTFGAPKAQQTARLAHLLATGEII